MELKDLEKLFQSGEFKVHRAVNPNIILISSIHEADHIALDINNCAADQLTDEGEK